MSVLSYQDIIRELGRGILFHPLKADSVKACDLCLTASEYAYAIGQQKRLTIETESNQDQPGKEKKFFYIPPRDTALVWTDESIWLNNYMCGLINSRVGLVSQGLGHLGTRVNPSWSGVLCIALHNVSNEPLRINVRDINEPIAYLMVQRLSSQSSKNGNIDIPARLDILNELPNTNEIYAFFNQRKNKWMSDDKVELKRLLVKSDEYIKLKRGFSDIFLRVLGSDEQTRWTAVAAIGAILSAVFAALPLFIVRK
jgi:deoxycytidine triphosphate deaminase